MVTILQGHCIDVMRTLPAKSVHCCVTSPPYWGLRDYGIPPQVWGGKAECAHEWSAAPRTPKKTGGTNKSGLGNYNNGLTPIVIEQRIKAQSHAGASSSFCAHCNAWRGCHGLEPTPELFVQHEVLIFRDVWRVLRDDGTIWVNLGDSYANDGKWGGETGGKQHYLGEANRKRVGREKRVTGLKPKDLIGVPWRVAFALQADGWYLRSDIIWHKPNPMPESITDRPTKAHEYIFLLTKSERYYYDSLAIKEKVTGTAKPRRGYKTPDGWDTSTGNGGHGGFHKEGREEGFTGYEHKPRHDSVEARKARAAANHKSAPTDERNGIRPTVPGVGPKSAPANSGVKNNDSFSAAVVDLVEMRNKRDVWTIPSHPFKEAHFATFPPALIRPCILAGCPKDGTVLDIFGGSGTTGEVAEQEGRNSILIELNPEYVGLAERRTAQAGLLHST